MKKNVILFLAGLLAGAIISTGSIYFYTVAENNANTNQPTEMQGEMGQNQQSGMNGQDSQTPPSMPSGSAPTAPTN